MTSIMLVMGFLANPTTTITIPAFSQEGSVSIAPGAANPNNDQSFYAPQISVSTGSTFFGQTMIQYNIL